VIAGSTVPTAANIQLIARARAAGSAGRRPAWRVATWSTIAPDSKRATSPSSKVGICPNGWTLRCAGAFIAVKETGRTAYGCPTSSSAQRTRMSRAMPLPPSGERSKAVMVMLMAGSLPLEK
jgi:hypothetical protein